MSKDERFLINNMRLQSKQFCVAFYKRDVLPGKLLYWEAKKEGALHNFGHPHIWKHSGTVLT